MLTFEAEITFHRDFRNDYYVSYGPLVYCLELPAKETIKRELRVPGCCDKIYTPVKRSLEHLLIAPEDLKQFRVAGKNNCPIWNSSKILGVFLCGGRKTELEMVPMARTILRKITFSPERRSGIRREFNNARTAAFSPARASHGSVQKIPCGTVCNW